MEFLDIVDAKGEPTGIVKERNKVHHDGDLHRTAHVWIVRDNNKGGMDILLQKRSDNKDSFPGCYDISSAGHIPAGCGYVQSALRELQEELGIVLSKEALDFRGVRRIESDNVFHGKIFKDRQITKVYRVKLNNLNIEDLSLQKEEVESVLWMDYEKCLRAVKDNTIKHCIYLEELEMLR